MKGNKGNTFLIIVCFVAVTVIILFFAVAIYFSQINSILYNIKLDMYSINKSAVISINKGKTSREKFSYDKNEYENYFRQLLMKNYNLDSNLKSQTGLVREIKILEYSFKNTNRKQTDNTIHSVVRVSLKPLIFEDWLHELFTFNLEEDVALNKVIT